MNVVSFLDLACSQRLRKRFDLEVFLKFSDLRSVLVCTHRYFRFVWLLIIWLYITSVVSSFLEFYPRMFFAQCTSISLSYKIVLYLKTKDYSPVCFERWKERMCHNLPLLFKQYCPNFVFVLKTTKYPRIFHLKWDSDSL